jgi:hypothetical protein
LYQGKVPKNEYGNVELFKPSMLPGGTVHIHGTELFLSFVCVCACRNKKKQTNKKNKKQKNKKKTTLSLLE